MPHDRFRLPVAVYGILRVGEQVLMLRRAGTTFRAGQLSLPAGHLEGGEDAVAGLLRELREEVGVEATPTDCRLALVVHSAPEDEDDLEYLHLFFVLEQWSGEPVVGEPDKCSELVWVSPAALPGDVVDYVAEALQAIERGESLLLHGW
ncbi:NUDIX hydrolase [Kineococcus radiotolerans]|uniref:NUDIX hydrolase n=1 Tax=Kineococcus radiotolerans TaxID=131568 RepID=UPI00003A3C8F|nr:NUDIX domain-containing protein [Kineococcus radiotolerans]